VDLWGGWADRELGIPWREETQTMVFSATKGLAAMALMRLMEEGKVDYDKPVTSYWPEFGENGKESITVRQLVNHRSGLVAFDRPLSLSDVLDWEPVVSAMVRQRPEWEAGSEQGYGAVTLGAYVAELVRRISGKTVGQILKDSIAGPLGADTLIGVPSKHIKPIATIYPVNRKEMLTAVLPRLALSRSTDAALYRAILRKQSLTRRSVNNPAALGVKGIRNYNRTDIRGAELPWVNAFTTARGLSKIYATMAMGGRLDDLRLFDSSVIAPLQQRQSWSECDRVVLKPLGFSQGFVKDQVGLFSPNVEAFGHPGAGGSVGFADPIAGVGMSYVMNKMDFRLRSPRCIKLCRAVYECMN